VTLGPCTGQRAARRRLRLPSRMHAGRWAGLSSRDRVSLLSLLTCAVSCFIGETLAGDRAEGCCWYVCDIWPRDVPCCSPCHRRTTQEAADLAREVKQLAVGAAPAPSDSTAPSSTQASAPGAGLPLTPVASRPERGPTADQVASTPHPTLPGAGTPGTGRGSPAAEACAKPTHAGVGFMHLGPA
jgi:hypothetical protein